MELRIRNVAEQRAEKAEMAALLPGQRLPRRFPGGEPAVVEKADAALVRSFYAAYYQPERATLVVVGDIDVTELERRIRALFGTWQHTATAAGDPDFGRPATHATGFRAYGEASLPTSVSAEWVAPYDPATDSAARERREFIERIGTAIVNNRLAKAALAPDAPFTSAALSIGDLERSARVAEYEVVTTPAKWSAALAAAQGAVNAVLADGVTQAEVDREVRNAQNADRVEVEGAATRPTPGLAWQIVSSLADRRVVMSPRYAADLHAAVEKGLSARSVSAELRRAYAGPAALVFLTDGSTNPAAETELAAAWRSGLGVKGKVDTALANADIAWPFTNFGAPGSVAARTESPEQGATFVRFANGVVVGVRPTTFEKQNVHVQFRLGSGVFAQRREAPVSTVFASYVAGSGLGMLDNVDVEKALTGKSVSAAVAASDDDLVLEGVTTPTDLATQLQYLTAFLTAPGFGAGAFQQARESFLSELPQLEAQPISYLSWRLGGFLRNGDPRWVAPTIEAVRGTTLDSVRGWLGPILANAPLQVSIVGDVTVDQAIALAAATVGAIAPRPVPAVATHAAGDLVFPAPTPAPLTLTHSGSKDQSAVAVAWPMPVWQGNPELPALRVLGALLRDRLLQAVRSDNGTSYTASAGIGGSEHVPDFGYLAATSVVKPDKVDWLLTTIRRIAADLRTTPVAADRAAARDQSAREQHRHGDAEERLPRRQSRFAGHRCARDRPVYPPCRAHPRRHRRRRAARGREIPARRARVDGRHGAGSGGPGGFRAGAAAR